MTTSAKDGVEDLPFGQESFARMMKYDYALTHTQGVELFRRIGDAIAETLEAGDHARLFGLFTVKIVDGVSHKKLRVRHAAASRLIPLFPTKPRPPRKNDADTPWMPRPRTRKDAT